LIGSENELTFKMLLQPMDTVAHKIASNHPLEIGWVTHSASNTSVSMTSSSILKLG
jgi:hypothetical protein